MQIPPAMRLFLSMNRLPWSVQALLVCVAFLLVGSAIGGDYGIVYDSPVQRDIAARNLAFITGAADRLDGFLEEPYWYYGVAFELPLLLLERGVGLEDSRRIYLLRHLVTHAFFLVGGWCCSLLVYRLTRSRTVALFALLLFVLQPRLYAHSFFNSKDLPFLSMFMVTLYVTHRAFCKDTVGAFVLCGVCVGVLTNLRIMGMMLYPAVLALRGLDLGQAGRGKRAHVLGTGAVFAVVGPGTLYVLSPFLWTDPFAFGTALQTSTWHPVTPSDLFQGRTVDSAHRPWDYIPTWVVISTPLVTLACGVLGGICVCAHTVRRPRAALRNTDLRFGLLLLACLTLPVLAIIGLGAHLHHGWRHVYFLHASLCGLAGVGMHWAGGGGGRQAAAGGVYALAGLGVLVTGVDMIQIHPHQQVYFNRLVDRTTPESLRTHYILDPWTLSCREGLEFLRRRYPATRVYVARTAGIRWVKVTLPRADRRWLVMVPPGTADVTLRCGRLLQTGRWLAQSFENALYKRKVYNNTLVVVRGHVTVPERHRRVVTRVENTYRGIVSGRAVATARFALYTYPGARLLGYARRDCTARDVRAPFFVHVYPEEVQALPAARRRHGFDNRDFFLYGRGATGECWGSVELPAYGIARIHTGQYDDRGKLWETNLVEPIYTPLTMR